MNDAIQFGLYLIAITSEGCNIIHCDVTIGRTIGLFNFSHIRLCSACAPHKMRFHIIRTNSKRFTRNISCIFNCICFRIIPYIGIRSTFSTVIHISAQHAVVTIVTNIHAIQLSMDIINMYVMNRRNKIHTTQVITCDNHIVLLNQRIKTTQIIRYRNLDTVGVIRIYRTPSTVCKITVSTELIRCDAHIIIFNHSG